MVGMDKAQKSDVQITDEKWRKQLTPEQYHVMREKGTEAAFTGKYWDNHESGMYRCASCGAELFDSSTKYESGSGWPSFYAPVEDSKIRTETDTTHGMRRVEALCAACGGHLGHVFPDGPQPTGVRYCMNSASLDFEKK
jgi:peptide-methionine (R)-S-oxide reductase